MRKRLVEVVEYSSSWPARFEAEAAVLRQVFGAEVQAIHHVGSTAVPGLLAKPTIDILVVVSANSSIPSFYARMRSLGYESRGECLDAIIPGTPGRHYFPRITNAEHLVHVHVCADGHPQIPEILVFRDYLRAHPVEATRYGKHKADLAARVDHDNVAYMREKNSIVRGLIRAAVRWEAMRQDVEVPGPGGEGPL